MAVCRKWAAERGCQAWSSVLLASAGFEDLAGRQKPNIVKRFLKMLGKPASAAKALFIPTAAVDAEAKRWRRSARPNRFAVAALALDRSPSTCRQLEWV